MHARLSMVHGRGSPARRPLRPSGSANPECCCPIRSASGSGPHRATTISNSFQTASATGPSWLSISSSSPSSSLCSRMAGEMDLADARQREVGEIVERGEAVIGRRDEDVVDVEQQAASGALRDAPDEIRLAHRRFAERQDRSTDFRAGAAGGSPPAPRRCDRRRVASVASV